MYTTSLSKNAEFIKSLNRFCFSEITKSKCHLVIRIFLIFIIAIISIQTSHANTERIDSLYHELAIATTDLDRINAMEGLAAEFINHDLPKTLKYAKEALALSQKIGDKSKEAVAHYNLAIALYETNDRELALDHFFKSEQLANTLDLKKLQVDNLMDIAKYYRYVERDSAKTVNAFLKTAEISKTIDYHWATGRSYAKLASFYTRYNQIDVCEKYLDLAVEYYKKYPTGELNIAHYYNEVGTKIWPINPKKSMDLFFKGKEFANPPNLKVSLAKAYNYIGDNETALEYLLEAIPHFRALERRKRMLGIAMGQLAEVYLELGNLTGAIKTCDEGIEMLEKLGRSDQIAIPVLLRVKGVIMDRQGHHDKAIEYLKKSSEEAIRIKFHYESVKSNLTLGLICASTDHAKGKKYCQKGLKDATRRKHTDLEILACDCLYHIYKQEKSYPEALKYHEQKILLLDSMSTMKVIHALDINSKIADKNKLLAEQSYQKQIRDKELKNQHILNRSLLVFAVLGALLIGFLTMNHQRIKGQNKEINEKTDELVKANLCLERSNQELERFAHIASHDLKSPLRNILNFTGLLQERAKNEGDKNINEWLDFIQNSGKRMNQLIEDILEFSQISSQIKRDKEIINLNNLVDETIQFAQSPDLRPVKFEVSKLPNLYWYHSKIFLLLKNIIENGIKYNQSKNPTIKIFCTNHLGVNTINISDNGIGIKKENFDKIFVMFNRLHRQGEYEGTGLGLATCKKIVTDFEGKITIESEYNKGTTFKIEIPYHLTHHQVTTPKEISRPIEKTH